jgi:type IV secretion system protein VirD4
MFNQGRQPGFIPQTRGTRREPVSPPDRIPVRARVLGLLGVASAVAVNGAVGMLAYLFGYSRALGPPAVDLSAWSWWPLFWGGLVFVQVFVLLWRPGRRLAGLPMIVGLLALPAWLGPIYSPMQGLEWGRAFASDPVLGEPIRTAILAGGGLFFVTLLALLPVTGGALVARPSEAMGSAAWGRPRDLKKREGLLLGPMPGPLDRALLRLGREGRQDRFLRYDGEGHLLTVAPTGTGKGVGPILSNLLTYPGSVVVTDPKAENAAVSRRYREEVLGQETVAYDPFQVTGDTASFNLLDAVDTGAPTAIDDARMLSAMMVARRGRTSESSEHFLEEARDLLAGLILYVCHRHEGGSKARSLVRVRELLTLDPDGFEGLLNRMSAEREACGGLIRRAASRLLQKAERERSGVISTAQRHTHFLDSPYIHEAVQSTTQDIRDLPGRPMTAYLILPAEHVDTYAAWLRLMVTAAWMGVVRSPVRPERRVLFLLDEFANLGRMDEIARALALVRGFGAQMWMFVQSLAQLESVYPDAWKAYLDVDVLQAFGTNDLFTAEQISRIAGDETVLAGGASQGRTSGRQSRRSRGAMLTERSRRLLLPDEVRRLDPDHQLLFLKGMAPVLAKKLRYFEDRELLRRADPNPYYVP